MNKKNKVSPYIENISEASAACLFTMVQGNIFAIGIGHLVIASQTGIIAGIIAGTAILFAKTEKRWLFSLLLGVTTGAVDFLIHPGMFGSVATEAIVTGVFAGSLSYGVGTAVRKYRSAKGDTDKITNQQ